MFSVNKDIFVSRLRSAMSAKRFTQADLVAACQPYADAKGLKLTKQKISKWHNGDFLPNSYDILEILGSALEVHPNYFLGMDVTDGITGEEQNLIKAWREATDYERETIAIMLRRYGFELSPKMQKKSVS